MRYEIENANVERVWLVIERFLKEQDAAICRCRRCISDTAALALNLLPPHYYVDPERAAEKGSPWMMVELAVLEALEQVANKPSVRCTKKQSEATEVGRKLL